MYNRRNGSQMTLNIEKEIVRKIITVNQIKSIAEKPGHTREGSRTPPCQRGVSKMMMI
jgi:hypothetical protein